MNGNIQRAGKAKRIFSVRLIAMNSGQVLLYMMYAEKCEKSQDFARHLIIDLLDRGPVRADLSAKLFNHVVSETCYCNILWC